VPRLCAALSGYVASGTQQSIALIGLVKCAYARLYRLRGDPDRARTILIEAVDLFERLGMRRDLTEARTELARLEELALSASHGSI
jgi:hypothetical protein